MAAASVKWDDIYFERAVVIFKGNRKKILNIKIESFLKFIYSEKATKFCKISTLLLSYVVPVKSKVEISQSFVALSEYMNFLLE